MLGHKMKSKTRNPIARDLKSPKYRPRLIRDKTNYTRKIKFNKGME